FTSAKQGPWTDIYGISATLYHAIVGIAPPSAFDRLLDDAYRPLVELRPEGFGAGLLFGIDAGLIARATDRPQSISNWRPLLGQTEIAVSEATVTLQRSPYSDATQVIRTPVRPASAPKAPSAAVKSRKPLWSALAMLMLLLAGGGYWYAAQP